MSDHVEIPAGYRLLEPGEWFRRDDKYWAPCAREWLECLSGGKYHPDRNQPIIRRERGKG